MGGDERRIYILDRLKQSHVAVSATTLAKELMVSRQVIVGDVALLRASSCDIVSTHRGYVISNQEVFRTVVKVFHTDDEIEDELTCIVDLGGTVVDVFVDHTVYGQIAAEVKVSSRKDVAAFVESMQSGETMPLKNITKGYHYHTIEANSERLLKAIEEELREKGYLVVEKEH
ncbi:MAG: transcription repressor NadR [Lachnospiraceae bacterium]